MNPSIETWSAQIRSGDTRAISRALTAIENGHAEAQLLLRELFQSSGRAWRIGITGAAGTGKSTLTNCLAAHYRALKKQVAIIAVDPSSPFTGGAILGDRIRMQDHATDDGVFIRSMAARGASGGLAQAAEGAALLLDAAGKEVILMETLGAGQDEVDVARVADCTLVVLVPGSGDEVQALKAGLMEIADIFVINKSDYEGAERFEQQVATILHLAPEREGWNPEVIRTVATEGKGIDRLAAHIERFRAAQADAGLSSAREAARWKAWLLRVIQQRVEEQIARSEGADQRLSDLASNIAGRKKDPYAAADELWAASGWARETRSSKEK